MQQITSKLLKEARNEAEKTSSVMRNAIIKNGIKAVALNHDIKTRQNYSFSNEIKTGKIQEQKHSGRCWMFAGINILRQKVLFEKKMDDFELSQAYLQVFEKFEKANYFLEKIIEFRDRSLTDREMSMLLSSPVDEGAWWQNFASLLDKYGCVPKEIMPETFHSGNVVDLNDYLNMILRQYAKDLRKSSTIVKAKTLKETQLKKIYSIITQVLGQPPVKFEYTYNDKKEKFHDAGSFTPKTFFKNFVNYKTENYIVLSNLPIKSKKMYATYESSFDCFVVGSKPVRSLNVPFEEIQSAAIKQVKGKEPTWYASGVGMMSDYTSGIMDEKSFLYEELFDQTIDLTKGEMIEYHEPIITHAMVLTGVHLKGKNPVRWKVENSWGDKVGKDGYFVMTHNWFKKFGINITINKKYTTKKILNSWKKKAIQVKPWDVFA